jgi:hypothetical protein
MLSVKLAKNVGVTLDNRFGERVLTNIIGVDSLILVSLQTFAQE